VKEYTTEKQRHREKIGDAESSSAPVSVSLLLLCDSVVKIFRGYVISIVFTAKGTGIPKAADDACDISLFSL